MYSGIVAGDASVCACQLLAILVVSYLHKKKNGKRPRKPETSIKYNFEEMENEFPFGTFQPEKQEYLFRRSVTLRKFLLKQPEKACSIYFPTGFSVNFL